jgi:hypothetical protein
MDPNELAALQLNRKEALKEAIEAGDKERALQYYEEFAQGKTGFHDFVVRWASMLLGYISEKMGDEAVHEVHQRFARDNELGKGLQRRHGNSGRLPD